MRNCEFAQVRASPLKSGSFLSGFGQVDRHHLCHFVTRFLIVLSPAIDAIQRQNQMMRLPMISGRQVVAMQDTAADLPAIPA